MTASSQGRVVATLALLSCGLATALVAAEGPVLTLRAVATEAGQARLRIELLRWSTDAERAPLLAALAPVPVQPATAAAPAAGRAAGRGGRAGRGGGAPPASPAARLTTAVKAAPTVGFIWGEGPTGYSIKYAWHAALPDGRERVVLVTDRRLGAESASWPASSGAEDEFTVMDVRIDRSGAGEAKTSHTSRPAVDAATRTLGLDGYDTAPVLLKVTR